MKFSSAIRRFALALILFSAQWSYAQQMYQKSVGLRLGSPLSISYKAFLDEENAFEAYLGIHRQTSTLNYASVGLAYLRQQNMSELLTEWALPAVKNLQYYYGGGVSGYFWHRDGSPQGPLSNTSWGVQGHVGVEYMLKNQPVTIGLEWTPNLMWGFRSQRNLGLGNHTLTIRYTLGGSR